MPEQDTPLPVPYWERAPRAVDLLALEQLDGTRPPGTHRDLFAYRVQLAAAALQGLLAGPVPEGASQHPIDLGLVAVQHADAVLWALLEKPCTHPEDDDAMLAALVPHLQTGMTDAQVRAATATLDTLEGARHV